MRPSKFAYAAGSLVFALVTPPVARLAVAAIALTLGLLAYWGHSDPNLVMGTVAQTKTEVSGGTLLGITPLWPWASAEVAIVPSVLVPSEPPYPGDWVIGFGEAIALEAPQDRSQHGNISTEELGTSLIQYLALSSFGLFSVGQDVAEFADVSLSDRIEGSNSWLVTILALGLTLFARRAMRLTACGVIGYIATVTSFVLLHLNAHDGLLSLPDALSEPLILAGGVAGFVLAFKATIGDSWRIGERLGAILVALVLTPLLLDMVDAPDAVAPAVLFAALLFPVLMPVTLASVMLTLGLDLQPQIGLLALGGLLVARQVAAFGKRKRKPAASAAFQPDLDETGAFDLNDLVTDRKE